jgi:DNA-binding winged helix-turn-helix (wHTH) protein
MEYRDELDRSATPKGGLINLAHEASIGLGPLTIEPALRLVRHDDGAEEILQPRIMQVLVALVRANGQILTRDALTASCWDGVVVGEDSINRVIGHH